MRLPTGASSPLRLLLLRPGFFKGRMQFGQSLIFFASAAATVNEWPQLENGQDSVISAALFCFAWAVLGGFGGPFGFSGKRRGMA
jgi:hypothetical protein